MIELLLRSLSFKIDICYEIFHLRSSASAVCTLTPY